MYIHRVISHKVLEKNKRDLYQLVYTGRPPQGGDLLPYTDNTVEIVVVREQYMYALEDSNNFKFFSPACIGRALGTYNGSTILKNLYTSFAMNPDTEEQECLKHYGLTGEPQCGDVTIVTKKLKNGQPSSLGAILYNSRTNRINQIGSLTHWSLDTAFINQLIERFPKLRYNSYFCGILKNYKYEVFKYLTVEDLNVPNPVYEDTTYNLGSYTTVFQFTCPICNNYNSPAGFVQWPTVFYNNNKRFVKTNLGRFPKVIISDPTVKLDWAIQEFENVLYQLSGCIQSVTLEEISKLIELRAQNYPLQELCDSIRMWQELYPNQKLPFSLSHPPVETKVNKIHNELLTVYNAKQHELEENKYNQVRTSYPKFEMEDSKFLIRYPALLSEVTAEGCALHHCVGSYVSRILEKEAYIMFIRRKSDPKAPFVTLHYVIKDGRFEVVQAHGKCNCNVNTISGVSEFIDKWCEKFHLIKQNINKVC